MARINVWMCTSMHAIIIVVLSAVAISFKIILLNRSRGVKNTDNRGGVIINDVIIIWNNNY